MQRLNRILSLSLLVFLTAGVAFAERANIKVSDVNTDEDTSIVIKKGPRSTISELPEFEVVSGEQDIDGDPAANSVDARASWKTVCADWKKEVKELNKDNVVLKFGRSYSASICFSL